MEYHWSRVSPRFKIEEVFSPETIRYPHLIDYHMLCALNHLAYLLDAPVFVNHHGMRLRGVRSAREQLSLKQTNSNAVDLSMHVQGKAVDVSCPTVSNQNLVDVALGVGFTFYKIYSSWIHFDTRDSVIL